MGGGEASKGAALLTNPLFPCRVQYFTVGTQRDGERQREREQECLYWSACSLLPQRDKQEHSKRDRARKATLLLLYSQLTYMEVPGTIRKNSSQGFAVEGFVVISQFKFAFTCVRTHLKPVSVLAGGMLPQIWMHMTTKGPVSYLSNAKWQTQIWNWADVLLCSGKFQPSCQNKVFFPQHFYNVPCVISHLCYMYVSWLPCQGVAVGEKAAMPETTVQDCVSTAVRVKPLVVFKQISGQFPWSFPQPYQEFLLPKPNQNIVTTQNWKLDQQKCKIAKTALQQVKQLRKCNTYREHLELLDV